MAISVLIVDDHDVVRHGLTSAFKDSNIRICGEVSSAADAVPKARRLSPDVVLLDVMLDGADSFEAIKRLRSAAPKARVVMFSAFDNPTYVARAVSAGAHDYLLKSSTRAELIAAVTSAAEGGTPSRSGEMRRMTGRMVKREAMQAGGVQFTAREGQVLRLVAMGLSNQEIADALEISIETVKEHVQNLLRKMSLRDRAQAALWAIRHDLA